MRRMSDAELWERLDLLENLWDCWLMPLQEEP